MKKTDKNIDRELLILHSLQIILSIVLNWENCFCATLKHKNYEIATSNFKNVKLPPQTF
jgi:hypothetical protein